MRVFLHSYAQANTNTHLRSVHLPTAGSKPRTIRGQTSFDITDSFCLTRRKYSCSLTVQLFTQSLSCYFLEQNSHFHLKKTKVSLFVTQVSFRLPLSRLPQPAQLQRSEGKSLLVSLDIVSVNSWNLHSTSDSIRLLASQ